MRTFALALTLPALMLAAAAFAAPPPPAGGDTLLMKRVHQETTMNLPARGMTMNEVLKRYGSPLRKLQPRGGDTPLHPVINRWVYAKYIVYFAHNYVVHAVLNTPAGNNRHPQAH